MTVVTKISDRGDFLGHQGSCFYDPAVKYFEDQPPDSLDAYQYIKYGNKEVTK